MEHEQLKKLVNSAEKICEAIEYSDINVYTNNEKERAKAKLKKIKNRYFNTSKKTLEDDFEYIYTDFEALFDLYKPDETEGNDNEVYRN